MILRVNHSAIGAGEIRTKLRASSISGANILGVSSPSYVVNFRLLSQWQFLGGRILPPRKKVSMEGEAEHSPCR